MSEENRRWTVSVEYDGRMLLDVPTSARSGDDELRATWVAGALAEWNHADDWKRNAEGLSARLRAQAAMLSENAFAALLFCPRGLPADALVEVFVVDTDLPALDDLDATMRVAVPQRIRPVASSTLGEGRAISSASVLPGGGVIGQIRYQFLSQGLFIETAVTSSDLGILGAGIEVFDALVSGITVDPIGRTGVA